MPKFSTNHLLGGTSLTFIVASFSARAYAQALVEAGHQVVTLDAFADADTARIAKETYRFRLHNFQVDGEDFKRVLMTLDLSQFDGFLYGSCFDAVPELLDWVASKIQIIGNTAAVMRRAKAFDFFNRLDTLAIDHPAVQTTLPANFAAWLGKRLGGSGGLHVGDATNLGQPLNLPQPFDYYQEKILGVPVSMLFLANGETAQPVGFNLQLLAPSKAWPYRYGGAVSACNLPTAAKQSFEYAAQQLTQLLGLRGVNSLDAILSGDKLWILELNPRLSATLSLYPDAMTAHLKSCAGERMDLPKEQGAKAHFILYADQPIEIATDFVWPEGVLDIPQPLRGESVIQIEQDSPICTIEVRADSAELAYAAVFMKAQQLRLQLGIFSETNVSMAKYG